MNEEPLITRRNLLGAAAFAGTAAALGSVGTAAAEPAADFAEQEAAWIGSWKDQMGFWVDTKKCEDCGTCAHACRRANETPEDQACRRKIIVAESSRGEVRYVSVSCMHCSDPSCMAVCPAGAISKRPSDGAVVVDSGLCIGCKYCYQACPFEVPRYGKDGMTKCDMCIGNGIYPGETPACAARCPHDALHFGRIRELLEMAGGDAVAVTGITGPSLIVS